MSLPGSRANPACESGARHVCLLAGSDEELGCCRTSSTAPFFGAAGTIFDASDLIQRAGGSGRRGLGDAAAHRRLGKILRGEPRLLCGLFAEEQPDQFQRFVQPRRDAAAGQPIAIMHEARMAINHVDIDIALETFGEGPVRRRAIAVEQPRRGE